MALVLETRKLNAVKFVSKKDGAIDREESDLEEYYDDIIKNADKLIFKEGQEPTYFLLNLEINAREDSMIKDSQAKGVDDDKQMVMSVGKWAYTVCKIVLKDIINPPGSPAGVIPFKKDGRGYVDDRTLDKLSKMGIVDEIWHQYLSLTKDNEDEKTQAPN